VALSDHYGGADFCTTLVYDAYRGEENGMLFAHEQAEILQMEDVATRKDTVWGDLESFGKNFCAFMDSIPSAPKWVAVDIIRFQWHSVKLRQQQD
jgi:hypothetical protein